MFNETTGDEYKSSVNVKNDIKRKKPTSTNNLGPYYRYIGETTRSVYERSSSDLKYSSSSDLKYSRMSSHMLKNCVLVHPNMDPSSVQFSVKVLSNHMSAFERQIKEAFLIHRNSGPFLLLLNSKS